MCGNQQIPLNNMNEFVKESNYFRSLALRVSCDKMVFILLGYNFYQNSDFFNPFFILP